jgi:hypothetical protein
VSRLISILIVPEGGQPRRYKISDRWLKIAAGVAGMLIVVLIVSVFSYARLFTKALERDRLVVENQQLLKENRRIVALSQEVEQSRRSLERIVRSLGGKLDLKEPAAEGPP